MCMSNRLIFRRVLHSNHSQIQECNVSYRVWLYPTVSNYWCLVSICCSLLAWELCVWTWTGFSCHHYGLQGEFQVASILTREMKKVEVEEPGSAGSSIRLRIRVRVNVLRVIESSFRCGRFLTTYVHEKDTARHENELKSTIRSSLAIICFPGWVSRCEEQILHGF